MTEDEFWIEPLEISGHVANVRASFNGFTVTICVERKDHGAISEAEAQRAYIEVINRVPPKIRGRHLAT